MVISSKIDEMNRVSDYFSSIDETQSISRIKIHIIGLGLATIGEEFDRILTPYNQLVHVEGGHQGRLTNILYKTSNELVFLKSQLDSEDEILPLTSSQLDYFQSLRELLGRVEQAIINEQSWQNAMSKIIEITEQFKDLERHKLVL